jgi:hypothetical protein
MMTFNEEGRSMINLEGKKDTGLWIANLVATTIICALMYKGISIFAHDEVRPEIAGKAGSNSLYMSFQVTK